MSARKLEAAVARIADLERGIDQRDQAGINITRLLSAYMLWISEKFGDGQAVMPELSLAFSENDLLLLKLAWTYGIQVVRLMEGLEDDKPTLN
jgi:hypothetical protein